MKSQSGLQKLKSVQKLSLGIKQSSHTPFFIVRIKDVGEQLGDSIINLESSKKGMLVASPISLWKFSKTIGGCNERWFFNDLLNVPLLQWKV